MLKPLPGDACLVSPDTSPPAPPDHPWRDGREESLTDDVFYAQAVLASGTVVDGRPGDALNLAAVSDAPVYVAAGLLER
jgi:hypothetical protein